MTKRASPVVAVTQTQIVKARLDPRLNEPYFSVIKDAGFSGCQHAQHGVKLDKTKQRAYCKKCGEEIALFDALWNYHHAEERLVGTLQQMQKMRDDEAARKQRERERRPFVREVVGRVARKDMTLKAEPIIGYVNELECGHKQQQNSDRHLSRVTCHECKNAAAKAKR